MLRKPYVYQGIVCEDGERIVLLNGELLNPQIAPEQDFILQPNWDWGNTLHESSLLAWAVLFTFTDSFDLAHQLQELFLAEVISKIERSICWRMEEGHVHAWLHHVNQRGLSGRRNGPPWNCEGCGQG